MTDYDEMIVPKIEEIRLTEPNQLWSNNNALAAGPTIDEHRSMMFNETNLLVWNQSRYTAQQLHTTREVKRRSSPANLQTQQLKIGDIMQDLNISDSQMNAAVNGSADLMLDASSASFDPGFVQRLPLKDDFFTTQKLMESWGPMISGIATPVGPTNVGPPQIGNLTTPLDTEFARRHSIAVSTYDWRSQSPDMTINQHTVEPKFIHDMSQIPCVLAPPPKKNTSQQTSVDQNIFQFPLNPHPMSRQDSQPLPSSVSPSSEMMSSNGSLTPTSQYIFGQECAEAITPMSIMSPEGYTNPSRKRSLVPEVVDTPIFNMSMDMFQSPAAHRKRTKSMDIGVMEYSEDVFESEVYEYPLMSQEDIEKAETDETARPRKQRIRYPGDSYTPKWVRYLGQAKEGYCDSCQPGKWLQLKNSAYWYHKQFFHGISSVSGRQFMEPIDQRWGDQDAIEGLCHQCRNWISICTAKRKNSVLWYRHAHKCHIYHKPKATQPKRRPSVQF
ncbi:unnamed protein product [Umbelopsis ramanniana]